MENISYLSQLPVEQVNPNLGLLQLSKIMLVTEELSVFMDRNGIRVKSQFSWIGMGLK